uniref:Nicotinamide/nicotinic acid mononucleotide adenylyltransferase isoform X2 n=1 Tax=Rhizophora mucronata TaxID=61149 RepID=A0A2P2M2H0_RHIMU
MYFQPQEAIQCPRILDMFGSRKNSSTDRCSILPWNSTSRRSVLAELLLSPSFFRDSLYSVDS